MDNPQIFDLIDNILPFEACLYYQILPLSIEGSRVRLGVVDPKDSCALGYARQLLSYLHCSLITEEISSEYQRSTLSSYLSHIGHQKQKKSDALKVSVTENNQQKINNSQSATVPKNKQFSDIKNGIDQDFFIKNHKNSQLQSSSKKPLCNILELSLPSSVQAISLEAITTLNPQKLSEQLLVYVLESEIGRLYFEQQQCLSKIIWIQNGVRKVLIENLEPNLIEAIINELKVIIKVSLAPIKKPLQVEIERIYKNNHILLCLKVMPGNYREKAILQVLKGEDLRVYQEQKLSLLSQDAVKLGKQLQSKINQVFCRQHLAPLNIDSLLTLHKLLDNIKGQTDCIISQQNNQFS